MEGNSSWLLEIILDDCCDQIAVQIRHGDRIGACIGPVEMGVDPVDCQPVGSNNVLVNNNLLLVPLVNGSPERIETILA